MKKLIVFVLSLAISVSTFSQLNVKETTGEKKEIGETKIGGGWMMGLDYYNSTETYCFSFKNMKYGSMGNMKYEIHNINTYSSSASMTVGTRTVSEV